MLQMHTEVSLQPYLAKLWTLHNRIPVSLWEDTWCSVATERAVELDIYKVDMYGAIVANGFNALKAKHVVLTSPV